MRFVQPTAAVTAGMALAVAAFSPHHFIGASASAASLERRDCNATEFRENVFTLTDFRTVPIKVLDPVVIDDQNGTLVLTQQEENGGVPSYAWLLDEHRVSDGFIADVVFTASGDGDGFALVFQKDRITNLNGRTARFLAFNDIARALAVAVDLCPGREGNTGCGTPDVMVQVHNTTGRDVVVSQSSPLPPSLTITDGNPHTLTVLYSESSTSLSVAIDNQPIIPSVPVVKLFDLFESRVARIGFTGSTSWDRTAEIVIESVTVDQLPSNTAVPDSTERRVDWGSPVNFTISFRDACGLQLNSTPPNALDLIQVTLGERVNDTNVPTPPPMGPFDVLSRSSGTVLEPKLKDNNDGSVTVEFFLPEFKVASWDLDVVVDRVRAVDAPYQRAASSLRPVIDAPSGFPLEWLILLILLLLLLLLIVVCVCVWLRRYQRKLKDNAEFIKAGQEQARLEGLEADVTYERNPMIGSADDLREQLERNQAELAKLRGRDLGEDEEHTLNQLERHRNELLAEMNRLKKEEQESEAGNSNFTGNANTTLARRRVEFNPQRTDLEESEATD